jgi:hypothetical protein
MFNDHCVVWTTTASVSGASLVTHCALILFRVGDEIEIAVVETLQKICSLEDGKMTNFEGKEDLVEYC